MGRFIGVDLHKNMFVVDFYEVDSGKHQLWKYRLAELGSFRRRLKKSDVLGVESTGTLGTLWIRSGNV